MRCLLHLILHTKKLTVQVQAPKVLSLNGDVSNPLEPTNVS